MRFVATFLSKLVDSLTEGIQKLNAKIVIVFLNMKLLRIILYNVNVYLATKNIQKDLMKN